MKLNKVWIANKPDPKGRWASEQDRAYARGRIIGPPKATDAYSAKELDDMGMVGIYVYEKEAE